MYAHLLRRLRANLEDFSSSLIGSAILLCIKLDVYHSSILSPHRPLSLTAMQISTTIASIYLLLFASPPVVSATPLARQGGPYSAQNTTSNSSTIDSQLPHTASTDLKYPSHHELPTVPVAPSSGAVINTTVHDILSDMSNTTNFNKAIKSYQNWLLTHFSPSKRHLERGPHNDTDRHLYLQKHNSSSKVEMHKADVDDADKDGKNITLGAAERGSRNPTTLRV